MHTCTATGLLVTKRFSPIAIGFLSATEWKVAAAEPVHYAVVGRFMSHTQPTLAYFGNQTLVWQSCWCINGKQDELTRLGRKTNMVTEMVVGKWLVLIKGG